MVINFRVQTKLWGLLNMVINFRVQEIVGSSVYGNELQNSRNAGYFLNR
jgi:hypothetical protein